MGIAGVNRAAMTTAELLAGWDIRLNIAQRFRQVAAWAPDKTALVCGAASLTYAGLVEQVERAGRVLRGAGVAPGDHLGVALHNDVPFVVLMLAAAELGVVLAPVSPTLSAAALGSVFRAAGVGHVVALGAVVDELCQSGRPEWLPEVGACLALGPSWETAGRYGQDDPRMDEGAEPAVVFPAAPPPVSPDTPFILTMTSGSTGDPKPIVLTQRNKVLRARAACELYGVTPADVTLAATPLYHSLAERLVLLPLLTGGTAVVLTRYTPTGWLETVKARSVSFTIAASSQLQPLLDLMLAGQETPASLRCLVSSSALLEPGLKARLLDLLPCDFHECYGASEIAIASNLSRADGQLKAGTVGCAAPGVDIRILGDDDQPQPPGVTGEIVCRTPMLFGGYFQRPEQTTRAMWGDYFCTGDLGMLDADGYLTYQGRKKDIVITGGVNVYPLDVEALLLKQPGVKACAVIPVPDEHLGEVVGAVLVLDDTQRPSLRSLQRACARSLADFQQPHVYFEIDTLPCNAMGKIMKPALIARRETLTRMTE